MHRVELRGRLYLAVALLTAGAWTSKVAAEDIILDETLAADSWALECEGPVCRINLAGGRPVPFAGQPDLPALTRVILVPADLPLTGIVVEPIVTHRVALPGSIGLTCGDLTCSGEVVAVAGSPPVTWGELRGIHSWRGYRLAVVVIYPFRLQPDASLEVLDHYRVKAILGAGRAAPPLARQRLVPGEKAALEAQLRRLVANPGAVASTWRQDGTDLTQPGARPRPMPAPSLEGSEVRYLILTNEALAGEFQRLADHRTAQGMPALVVTREWIERNWRHGADLQETLRLFLQEAYAFWGLQYVLLGGDTAVIPARYVRSYLYPFGGYTDIPADLYFSCLDGNWNADGDGWLCEVPLVVGDDGDQADLAPELGLGRAPVTTPADARVFVDKVLAYEEASANAAWASRALFLAEVIFPDDWQPGQPTSLDGATYAEQTIATSLVPCTTSSYARLYENDTAWPGSAHLSLQATIDSLNTGHFGIVAHAGHGQPYGMRVGDQEFRTSHAAALTNPNPFLLYSLNCESGAFDTACLLERLLLTDGGGAVAAIGNTRVGFPTTANSFQQEFFGQLACQEQSRIADALDAARLPFLADAWFENSVRWTYLVSVLLGDPALALWTGAPQSVVPRGPTVLHTGPQEAAFRIADEHGLPAAGVSVCLAKEQESYAYGTTDDGGRVTLAANPVSGGEIELTVSGQNLARTQMTVAVVPPSTYLVVEELALGENDGNGNGVPEAGEVVGLRVTLRDTGGAGADNVDIQMTTTTPGVTLLMDRTRIPHIPPGGSATAPHDLIAALAPDITDGTRAEFTLTATDGAGGSYVSTTVLEVMAPEPEPIAVRWEDTTRGDGDGIIDSGERLVIRIDLKNYGGGRLDACEGRLRCDAAGVVLGDTITAVAGLGLLESATASPPLSLALADPAQPVPCRIDFTDNHGRVFSHRLLLAPVPAPAAPQPDASSVADAVTLRWQPVSGEDPLGHHVYRATAPEGPFLRTDADLLRGITYFEDRDVVGLTTYYYRVTAVDSSLVESLPSPIATVVTRPVEQAGFPLSFAVGTSSHCAVGDVTGDGQAEIVVAADEIYVWDRTGQEILDGDDDPQTSGPITDFDGQFEPAGVTLADLDGQPGLEIIASGRSGGNRIYALRADGTALPGWPQTLSQWNWATPAAGDIDGDGDVEIVVTGLDGRTYAWHHDGRGVVDGDNNPATNGVFVINADTWWTYSAPALADLDGDGALDIIIATDHAGGSNGLYAYRHDRTLLPGFPYSTSTDRTICSPAVGDLDGDGTVEIVFFTLGHYLHAVRADGSALAGFPVYYPAPWDGSAGPSPALGDLDGDGRLEIVWPVNAGINRCDLLVVAADGTILPGWPVQLPASSESSPIIGDITGDGGLDIVFGIGGGSITASNLLYALRATGEPITGFPLLLDGPIRATPVIADLDGDHDVHLVLGGWDRLLHDWTLPFAYDPVAVPWPTFRGGMARTGSIAGAGAGTPVADPRPVPAAVTLLAPQPNPFNAKTTIRLGISKTQDVCVEVYDLRGRLVRPLWRGVREAGWCELSWDGCDAAGRPSASGIYLLRARAGGATASTRLTLVK